MLYNIKFLFRHRSAETQCWNHRTTTVVCLQQHAHTTRVNICKNAHNKLHMVNCHTYKKEMEDTTRMSQNERLRARRQQESHEQRENRLQLRRSRRLQARERESSEQRKLRLETRHEREGSRKPLSRDNNAWAGLEHAMMIKSFLSFLEEQFHRCNET